MNAPLAPIRRSPQSAALALVAGVALACLGPRHSVAVEQVTVTISYEKYSVAQETCARVLRDSVAQVGRASFNVFLTKDYEKPPQPALFEVDLHEESPPLTAGTILRVPFLFRDPGHFQAFLQSDLYRDLLRAENAAKSHDRWLATAYGGFYQLFSRDQAVIEPKHFYRQGIVGPNVLVYSRLGAAPAGIILENELAAMQKSGKYVRAVEARLIDAFTYGIDRVAHFVDLSFGMPSPVVFYAKFSAGVPRMTQLRVAKWAEAAAQKCSAENFATEQQTLERLKSMGLTAVPINRDAFVEAGWIQGLLRVSNDRWSVEDLDEIVALGINGKPKRLPSMVVASLNAKEKLEFRERTKNAAAVRRQRKGVGGASEAIGAMWATGLADITDLIEQTNPDDLQRRRFFARPGRDYDPDVVALARAKAELPDVDDYVSSKTFPYCTGTADCAGVLKRYAGVALALRKSGDVEAAQRVFAFIKQFATHTGDASLRLIVLNARAAADDASVKAALPAADNVNTSEPRYLESLALLHARFADKPKAAALLAQASASALADDWVTDRIDVANCFVEIGDRASAWELFERSVEKVETPRDLRLVLHYFLLQSKVLDDTAEQLLAKIAEFAKTAKVDVSEILGPIDPN